MNGMIVEEYALTWRKSLERVCAAHMEMPTEHISHFPAILSHLQNCFFTHHFFRGAS